MSRSGSSRRREATSRARRWVSTRGISIFTGHTSPHAPHRDDAYGSERAFSMPAQLRRQDRPDRPGIDGPVRVPAHPRVHRAHVQARRAADAAQRLAADLVGERLHAAVVQQHEVELARAVARGRVTRRAPQPLHTDVYGFIRSAVDERGSSCRNTSMSRQLGTTFSIPITVTSTSGSVVHIRPLPSDSNTQTLPVSATAKFAPLTPIRADEELRAAGAAGRPR